MDTKGTKSRRGISGHGAATDRRPFYEAGPSSTRAPLTDSGNGDEYDLAVRPEQNEIMQTEEEETECVPCEEGVVDEGENEVLQAPEETE